MAARLRRRSTDGVFEGKAGAKVEVAVRSVGPADTVRIIYAGEEDGEAPFTFKIQKGENKLLIAAVGVEDDQRMTVVEINSGSDSKLKTFFWSKSNFHTTLDIEGV